jgi:signal transduction histidine kinase
MVERTEVAREARRVAQQVISQAEADSRRLRHEAEDYIDQKLAAFEVVLERTMATVVKGREQLQAVVEPLPSDLPDEHTGLESMYDTGDPAVYDQDVE